METKVEKAISDFVKEPELEEVETKDDQTKKIIIDEREGLIERLDHIFVDKSGRMLLREQY